MQRTRPVFLAAFLCFLTPFVMAGEPTPLRLLTYMDGHNQAVLGELVERFNTEHQSIRVSLEYVPLGNMKKQLLVANASGDLPDMTILDNPDNAAMAASGLLADISTLVRTWPERTQFFIGPWQSTYYQNRQYGIPFTSNCIALFYNKQLLKEGGLAVPDSWDRLAKAAKALTSKDRKGFAISATRTEEGTFQYIPWLLSAGGSIRDISSREAAKSVQFLRSLIEEGSMSPDVLYWTQEDVMRQFVAGKTAMMINGPWNIENIRSLAPDLDFGIAKLPRDKQWASVLGGENLVIMKKGRVEESWAFVSWLCSAERIDEYSSRTGYFPPRRDVARTSERWNNDPLLTVFMDQMQYAMPRGPHPRWPEISQAIINAIQEGLSGTSTVEDALLRASARIGDIEGETIQGTALP